MVYSELKGIVIKTFGVVESIVAAFSDLSQDITTAFIYGSIASGVDTGRSDIDLMVIGTTSFRSLARALRDTENILARPINPTLFSPEEFRERVRGENHFLLAVLKSKRLFIIGNEDDLAGLAQ